jgi:uncharacterized membrane protein (DUF2068 family)
MERDVHPTLAPGAVHAPTSDLIPYKADDPPERGHSVVLLIGVYKLCKALVMLIVGVTALRLVHQNVVDVFDHWVHRLHLDPENRILEHQIAPRLVHLTANRLRLVGCGALAYVALYTVQGIGLLRQKRWAEWLTVVSSLGLVPVEVYGFYTRPIISRGILLVSNLAIAGFLYWHVRRKQAADAREQMLLKQPS